MTNRFSTCIRRSIKHTAFIPLYLFILIIFIAVLFVMTERGETISVSPVFLFLSMIMYTLYIALLVRIYMYARTILDVEISCGIISLGILTFLYPLVILLPFFYQANKSFSYIIDVFIIVNALLIELHYANVLSRVFSLISNISGVNEGEPSSLVSYRFKNMWLLRGFAILGSILVLVLFILMKLFVSSVSHEYLFFIVGLTIVFLVLSGVITVRYKITNVLYQGLRFASLYRLFTLMNILAILVFFGVAAANTMIEYKGFIDPYAVSFLVEIVIAMFVLAFLKYSLDDLVGLIIVSKVPGIAMKVGLLPIYMIVHDIPVMNSVSKVTRVFGDILRSVWMAGFPINTIIYISKPHSLIRALLLFNFYETYDEVKTEITSLGKNMDKLLGNPIAHIFNINISYPTSETLPRQPRQYFGIEVHERSITFERIYLIRSIMGIIRRSKGVLLVIEDLSDLINISSFTTVYSLIRTLISLLRPNVDAMVIITPKYRPHEEYINVFKSIANSVVDVTRLLI